MTKKSQILVLLKTTDDSNDMIALKTDSDVSYVVKVEADMYEADKKITSLGIDITNLKGMLKLYNNCSVETKFNLNDGFHTDMVQEINIQIKHCEESITNLEKNLY